ncbi:MAG: hypothetical protein A2X34_02890 [Elusimicrobia bacterium GWC2_51_8]|nr:MAG: hypothetical protein A2X33_00215 [Elusimicrobia bacterium GWA2_51_34]OGR64835.1 MAG: hypothetical protein A2X34_02890 [Elusimicrobia bacterium GWC2_51_8]OGR88107.1 MAG: hypothetical protein A2021_00190 [Elusimicrobia bacterium GWF2_52_66]HAF96654.1 hypothetical protein [Elusimicrobiota bacterium]HCE98479.1 hypothetical protein [Elusimicrobiota bacterium]
MKFNIYTAWMDPIFYAVAATFAVSLFSLVYSIRRYVELKNSDEFDEIPGEDPVSAALPAQQTRDAIPPVEQPGAEFEATVRVEPEAGGSTPQPDFSQAAAPRVPSDSGAGRAETFVRGIYEELSGVDARLKNIEASVSKSRVNSDFTVKFLEDILSDLDALDKEKIKARIEYLLSDLKK